MSTDETSIYSPDSIIKFAQYLQAKGDFRRAANEYERALAQGQFSLSKDEVGERLARCFLSMHRNDSAAALYGALAGRAPGDSSAMRFRINQIAALLDGGRFTEALAKARRLRAATNSSTAAAVQATAYLHLADPRSADTALATFVPASGADSSVSLLARSWVDRYRSLGRKSPEAAGLLAALIPGSGKIYAGQARDGLIALGLISFFALQSVDGFQHNGSRSIKGWLFSAITLDFYVGNIYGSVLEVRSYNKRLRTGLLNDIDFSLRVQVLGR